MKRQIDCFYNKTYKDIIIYIFICFLLKLIIKKNKSELCEIGRKYDTDKSSQRDNITNQRHCHPYTLFYEELFKNKKHDNINIAELGILEGSSLRMWQEYFTNANIYGFEYDNNYIENFINNYDNERIILNYINVKDKNNIIDQFSKINKYFDVIIDDSTHQFEDQIKIIENTYQYLKPGGFLIIEDVFKSYNEKDYIEKLSSILHNFQDYYFIELDHVNKLSTGWDNDKLFILVKNGAEPIFKSNNKITIITPSYRLNNLDNIYKSINFNYIDEWIIVYDQTKIIENPYYFKNLENDKIKEYIYKSEGISGNPQRNFALTKVTNKNTILYYLDDDNIIHPSLYKLLNFIDNCKMYSFNQKDRIKGNNINPNYIDTAMVLIPYNNTINCKWIINLYGADGYYIKDCYHINIDKHVFIDNDLSYYNYLSN